MCEEKRRATGAERSHTRERRPPERRSGNQQGCDAERSVATRPKAARLMRESGPCVFGGPPLGSRLVNPWASSPGRTGMESKRHEAPHCTSEQSRPLGATVRGRPCLDPGEARIESALPRRLHQPDIFKNNATCIASEGNILKATSEHVDFSFAFPPRGCETGLSSCTLSRLPTRQRHASWAPRRVHAVRGHQRRLRQQYPPMPAVRGPPPKGPRPLEGTDGRCGRGCHGRRMGSHD